MRAGSVPRRPSMMFLWQGFAPHHDDRCAACAVHFSARYDVYGVEITPCDADYGRDVGRDNLPFTRLTLFPGESWQDVGTLRCTARIVATALRLRSRYVFMCNYEAPTIFLSAVVLRLLRRRLIVMQDSKFDDKQRRLGREIAKSILYRPYQAALVAGSRAKAYLQFLRFPEDRIFVGYDTVSVDRLRKLARSEPAPAGAPHASRHFTVVARLIPKKNLPLALDAYAEYRAAREHDEIPSPPRELHFCGSGELEPALREQARRLGLDHVHFHGHVGAKGIACILASTLALVLPSVEEQHGLVVNEALAMGVPVLVSDNCGARDLLVRSGVNGYIFEPDNAHGLAHFMSILDRDADEWRRLSHGTREFLPAVDSGLFVASVERVLDYFSS